MEIEKMRRDGKRGKRERVEGGGRGGGERRNREAGWGC